MIDAIVFDFGNVLAHFDHGRTLSKLKPLTEMSAEDMYAAIYDGELEDAFESGQVGEAEFVRQFRHLCGLRDCEDAFLTAAIADIFWPNAALCQLIPRLKPRYRLVLGSNTNPIHSRHFKRTFADTLRHFDALVLSHEVGVRKPQAEFFEHCRQRAGCPAERCVFVDDLLPNVAGAIAGGWQGVVYTGTAALREDLRRLNVRFEDV